MTVRPALYLSLLALVHCAQPSPRQDVVVDALGDSPEDSTTALDAALDTRTDAWLMDRSDAADAPDDHPASSDASPCDGGCALGFECVEGACAQRDWARPIDPALIDGITSTTDGAIVVAGRIISTPFRHGVVTLPRPAGAFTNVFLAKWTRSGAVDSARVLLSAPGGTLVRIAAAPDGSVFVAFELGGSVVFDTGTLSPVAARDVVLARLDRNLVATSATMIGGPATKSLTGLAQRGDGAVLSFASDGAVSLGGATVLGSAGGSALVAFDSNLVPVAHRGFVSAGASGSTTVQAQSASPSGAVHAIATLTGSYDFGAGTVTSSSTTTPVWLSLDSSLSTQASIALEQPTCGALATRTMNVTAVNADDVLVSASSWCATTLGARSLSHLGLQDVHAYWASRSGVVSAAHSYASAGSDQHAPATSVDRGAILPVSVDGTRGAIIGGTTITAPLRAMTLVRTDARGSYAAHRVINTSGSTQAMLSASAANNTAALVLMVDVTDTVLGEPVTVGGEFGRTVIARAGVD